MSALLCAAALSYGRRGWLVFPLRPKSKEPACHRGFYAATANPATIRRWFDNEHHHNVAVRTGNGLAVLDVDGDLGRGSLSDLEFEYGRLPTTLTSSTGNGLHYWFAVDGPAPSSTGKIGAGLDLKADGGYVACAPSHHPNGKIYAWVDDTIPLAPMPSWLLRIVRSKRQSISERALASIRRTDCQADRYGAAALDREIAELAIAPPGTRNASLNRTTFKLFQLVAGGELERDHVLDRLINACHRNGLAKDDGLKSVNATIASGMRAGMQHPRSRGAT